MNEQVSPITINILGKDYNIACSPSERDELINSAHELNKQMQEIRDTGNVIGVDRIAVMAALNITHELHQLQGNKSTLNEDIKNKLALLRLKIENVLESV